MASEQSYSNGSLNAQIQISKTQTLNSIELIIPRKNFKNLKLKSTQI